MSVSGTPSLTEQKNSDGKNDPKKITSGNIIVPPELQILGCEEGKWDWEMEPLDKLGARFIVYKRALMYLAEHFDNLRPILAEIEQAYQEMVDMSNNERWTLDLTKLDCIRLEQQFKSHEKLKDKEGDAMLTTVRIQIHALQQHAQFQQHTLNVILGLLWKMRQSLKLQNRLIERRTVDHKVVVDRLAKEIVLQRRRMMLDTVLPGKFTEIMDRFKNIKDPRDIKRILSAQRKLLRDASRRLVKYEANYADTVTRTEYDLYNQAYLQVHARNTELKKQATGITDQIDKVKATVIGEKLGLYAELISSGLLYDELENEGEELMVEITEEL